jgi:hypothetical protein
VPAQAAAARNIQASLLIVLFIVFTSSLPKLVL